MSFILIVFSIAVGISLVALTWIHKLEEISCKCSEDFKRDYIKYFLYIYIGLYTVAAFSSILQLSGYRYKINTTLFKIFKIIFYIASLLNSIFAIIYIYRLKEIDCKCSEDVRREIYYVLNWITPTEKKNETKLYKIIKSISFSSDVNDNIKVANYNLTTQERFVVFVLFDLFYSFQVFHYFLYNIQIPFEYFYNHFYHD